MRQLNILIAAALLIITASCKKDKSSVGAVPPPVPVTPIDTFGTSIGDTVHIPQEDTARFLLKDVVSSGMPSPYYHFDYDSRKYVTKISFASNFNVYNLEYANNRLSKMTDINNGHQMLYSYANGKVAQVTELAPFNAQILWKYFFEYNILNQLVQIKWLQFRNSTDSVNYRKLILQYQADGNLERSDDFIIDAADHLNWSNTTIYQDYDNAVNVSDFSMFRNFFESLLYIPGVHFQKHNHRTEIITGPQNDYRITYTFQYDGTNLPLVENGTMIQTRGSNAGQSFSFNSHYSYY